MALRSAGGVESSAAWFDRVGGVAASERANRIIVAGEVEVRSVDRVAGSNASFCCVRCVARVRVLERGFREGALCIRDPDRGEYVIFISVRIAIRRGIVHVTVTRQ